MTSTVQEMTSRRSRHFDHAEDRILAQAFLYAMAAVTSIQLMNTGATIYRNMLEFIRQAHPMREWTVESIMSRWSTILQGVKLIVDVRKRHPLTVGEDYESWKTRLDSYLKKEFNKNLPSEKRSISSFLGVADYLSTQDKFMVYLEDDQEKFREAAVVLPEPCSASVAHVGAFFKRRAENGSLQRDEESKRSRFREHRQDHERSKNASRGIGTEEAVVHCSTAEIESDASLDYTAESEDENRQSCRLGSATPRMHTEGNHLCSLEENDSDEDDAGGSYMNVKNICSFLAAQDGQLKQLQSDLETKVQYVTHLEGHFDQFRSKLAEKEEGIKDLEGQVKKLQRELRTKNLDLQKQARTNQENLEEIQQCHKELASLKKEQNDAQEKISALVKSNATLREQWAEVQAECQESEDTIQAFQDLLEKRMKRKKANGGER